MAAPAGIKITKVKLHNLENRAAKAMMSGYSSNRKAYRLWDMANSKIVESRDVKFDQSSVPPLTSVTNVSELSKDALINEDVDSGDDDSTEDETTTEPEREQGNSYGDLDPAGKDTENVD